VARALYSPKTHEALATNPNKLIVTFMSNGPEAVVAADTRLYVPQAVRLTLQSMTGAR
jgi:hypothetical protein